MKKARRIQIPIPIQTLSSVLLSKVFGFLTVFEFATARTVCEQWSKSRADWCLIEGTRWQQLSGMAVCKSVRFLDSQGQGPGHHIDGIERVFQNITNVRLTSTCDTDEKLRVISQMPTVRSLDVTAFSSASTAGFVNISGMSWLRELGLYSMNLGDDGLQLISLLSNLIFLDLQRCKPVSDSGTKHIAKLTKLHDLDLADTGVSSVGISELSTLVNLKRFSAANTWIGNRALRTLSQLEQITDLNFENCVRVSCHGLVHLHVLRNLKRVILTGTQVSDRALEQLCLHSSLSLTRDSKIIFLASGTKADLETDSDIDD